MRERTSSVALAISIVSGAVAALGCSSASGGSEPAGVARSNLARNENPDVTGANQAALEDGNASFAFDFFGQVRAGTGNVVFSPCSLSSALAMSYAGARGNTATELASALHFALPQDSLHPAFDWLDLQLASRAHAAQGGGSAFELRVASSAWVRSKASIEPAYLDTLAVNYGAGVELTDFTNLEASRQAVNDWASAATDGRIVGLVPAGGVDPNTVFMLVNAIAFDAHWAQPFQARDTANGAFVRFDGSTAQASMMSQTATFPYASGDGYQAIELAYEGSQVAMDVFLPAAGTAPAFEAGLTASQFASIVSGLQPMSVFLSLPKVRLPGASVELASAFEHLGARDAFIRGTADFSGITGNLDLFIARIFHQAFLAVDENGTQAAAATAVVFDDASVALNQTAMNVNRAFFFAIRDVPTKTILFMGRIADPTL